MFSSIARRVATVGRNNNVVAKRNFGSHSWASPEERIKQCTELTSTWKNISFAIAIPATVAAFVFVFGYKEHKHPDPDRVCYPHSRVRRKPFPFFDGDKTLFHDEHNNF